MTSSHPAKPSGAPGIKILVTAASVAATVGGWALLTAKQAQAQSQSASAALPVTAPAAALNLPPLPTIVPPPAQSAPQAAPFGGGAAAAAAPAPALRVVSAPPVSSTQSSR